VWRPLWSARGGTPAPASAPRTGRPCTPDRAATATTVTAHGRVLGTAPRIGELFSTHQRLDEPREHRAQQVRLGTLNVLGQELDRVNTKLSKQFMPGAWDPDPTVLRTADQIKASNIDFIAGTAATRLGLGPTGAVCVADGRSIPRVAD